MNPSFVYESLLIQSTKASTEICDCHSAKTAKQIEKNAVLLKVMLYDISFFMSIRKNEMFDCEELFTLISSVSNLASLRVLNSRSIVAVRIKRISFTVTYEDGINKNSANGEFLLIHSKFTIALSMR